MLNIPLMSNNIDNSDIDVLIDFLKTSDRFTNGPKVREFESAWSEWLCESSGGVKQSLFVNSGSSANFMTLAAIKELYGDGEVILSPIGWSSDVSAVIAAGFKPIFVDVNFNNLALNVDDVLRKINSKTRAVLLTHVLGYNALTSKLIEECRRNNIILVEDVCESHGASFEGKKCGSHGDVSNFSFYYAHHMSTIEGGMVCTDNNELHRILRMYRSHGMLRECDDAAYIEKVKKEYPELHPEFIFMCPGYNMRSTELNAVIGLNQLKRLDYNISRRIDNYKLFIEHLDSDKYYTEFLHEGSSNYAFVILLREANEKLFKAVVKALDKEKVEYRRGTAGGGNLTRQPFVQKRFTDINPKDYPNAEHIHKYGLYTGNYPDLSREKIMGLCEVLNSI